MHPRCGGPDVVSKLQTAFENAADRRGKSFCRYSDAMKTKNAALDTAEIKECEQLLAELRCIDQRFAFKPRDIEAALAVTIEKFNGTWQLKAHHVDEWVSTIKRRVINMMSRVHDGEARTPTSHWVVDLPWNRGGGVGTSTAAAVKRQPSFDAEQTEQDYGETHAKANRKDSIPI